MKPLVLLLAIALAAAATSPSSPTAREEAVPRCSPGSTPAAIAGRQRCLRSGQGCTIRRDSAYHRYGFHCHNGVLEADLWFRLRRVLRLEDLETGAACPRAAGRQVHPGWGIALTGGPPFPLPFTSKGMLPLLQAGRSVDGWYIWKTIWIAPPGFVGPVLVRGRRLDGPGDVRFSGISLKLQRELRLLFRGRLADSWQEGFGPRYTRVHDAGCYGFQVDTRTGTRVIVFEARD